MNNGNQYQQQENTVNRSQPQQSDLVIVYEDKDIQEGIDTCKKSLIAKILTEKPIHKGSLLNALSNIWGNPTGFRIEEIEPKLYQIFMEDRKDINRILLGNPWIFRNSWLVMKEWQRDIEVKDIDFGSVPIWVQIWGLPPHCKTIVMGKKIGSCLGKVLDTGLFEFKDKKITIKVKIDFDVSKPIKIGANIGSLKDGVTWVDFRYEKLPLFCYICGLVGHGKMDCPSNANLETSIAMINADQSTKLAFGPWIRASQNGGRLIMDAEGNSSNARYEEMRKGKKALSAEFLQKLAELNVPM